MLLKKTDNAKEMVQWIQGVGIRSLARIKSTGPTINYPCHATDCTFIGKQAHSTYIHHQVGHEKPIPDKVCMLCEHLLLDSTMEFHWRCQHSGYTCKVNKYSMTLYWSHMNEMHHEILENLLIPKLIVQLHDKLVNREK
jgi:hypothetical protein